MNDIVRFLISIISYFIIAHFIYRVFGKIKWSYIFLSVILISTLYEWIPIALNLNDPYLLIYSFIIMVFPILFSSVLFIKFTGGLRFKTPKIKRTKFKESKDEIFTTSYLQKFIYMMFFFALVVIGLTVFFIEGLLFYLLIIVSSGVILYGIWMLYQLRAFRLDKIILIVGKQKEYIYEHILEPKKAIITIKDIYKNEDYLIDKFATIYLYEQKKLVEKHYLYWIATSQVFDIEDPQFKKIELGYKEHIQELMKYHDAIIKLEKHKLSYSKIKEKKYRK